MRDLLQFLQPVEPSDTSIQLTQRELTLYREIYQTLITQGRQAVIPAAFFTTMAKTAQIDFLSVLLEAAQSSGHILRTPALVISGDLPKVKTVLYGPVLSDRFGGLARQVGEVQASTPDITAQRLLVRHTHPFAVAFEDQVPAAFVRGSISSFGLNHAEYQSLDTQDKLRTLHHLVQLLLVAAALNESELQQLMLELGVRSLYDSLSPNVLLSDQFQQLIAKRLTAISA